MIDICHDDLLTFVSSARLAKMLIVAHNTGVLSVQLSTAIVACLSERFSYQ